MVNIDRVQKFTDMLHKFQEAKNDAVVVITGYGDDPIALEAISIGPQLLMRKPFTVSDIVEVLNLVVKTRR